MAEILIDVEQNNLAITTADTDFIIGNCLNTFDTLSAYILCENQNLVFDLEAAEISTLCTSEKEFLGWLTESKAAVISDKGSSVNEFGLHLSISRIKRP